MLDNGGIDLSVGPVAGLVNVVIVSELVGGSGITSPVVIVAAALAAGLAVGLFNGVVVAYLRIQPIVATLGSYLICIGITLSLMPTPGAASRRGLVTSRGPPRSSRSLRSPPSGCSSCTPFYVQLIASSDDERAAFTSGIDTARIRLAAYALGGL